jgi:hypothetical protein
MMSSRVNPFICFDIFETTLTSCDISERDKPNHWNIYISSLHINDFIFIGTKIVIFAKTFRPPPASAALPDAYDAIAARVRQSPDRYAGLAAIPDLSDPLAILEFRIAVSVFGFTGGWLDIDGYGSTPRHARERVAIRRAQAFCDGMGVPLFISSRRRMRLPNAAAMRGVAIRS